MIQVQCSSCGVRLSVPDEKLPANLTHFRGKCPKCQNMIEVDLNRGAGGAGAANGSASSPPAAATPAAAPASSAPPPAAPPPPAPMPASSAPAVHDIDEDFAPGMRLALACFDDEGKRETARAALEGAGFTVHLPKDAGEAVARLRRSKYEVLLLDEAYGGSRADNQVLRVLQPMPMAQRRHMCVGLVGKDLRTFDNMAAFASSVSFVIGEKDFDKLKELVLHAIHDNEAFYRPFLEALKGAGKA